MKKKMLPSRSNSSRFDRGQRPVALKQTCYCCYEDAFNELND